MSKRPLLISMVSQPVFDKVALKVPAIMRFVLSTLVILSTPLTCVSESVEKKVQLLFE